VTSSASIDLTAPSMRAAGAALLGTAVVRTLVAPGVGFACPLHTLTGVPCPFCGMTRGVTSIVHGDLVAAFVANPGSILLVVAAIAAVIGWPRRPVTLPAWSGYALVGALWAFQLVIH
jgi:hypothetical protein